MDISNFQSESRIFLLSPARTAGKRADLLHNPKSEFEMARRIRDGGAAIGDVFSFLSGLYFRGKLAYANRFSRPESGRTGVWIITSNRGLLSPQTVITTQDLLSFQQIDINPEDPVYAQSLETSARELLASLPPHADVVLLGSISSRKYVELLLQIFDVRLKFPTSFIGRGDMSRGGLMLRAVAANQELEYIPLAGAVRHGKRPPKLEPLRK